jgi:GT2 family glycosyltransferase
MTADLELSDPLPLLPFATWSDAEVVVRLHGLPLGAVTVDLSVGEVRPEHLEGLAVDLFAREVEAHLAADGIDDLRAAPPDGGARHRCVVALEPAPPPPRITVVIPTRDRCEALGSCLESVLRSDYPDFEVVVVDNAPSDDTTRSLVIARSVSDPRVRYERLRSPGASAARNHGARRGTGELLAFTDDDAVVGPLWLETLVAGFRDDNRVACVTGLTLPAGLATAAQQAFESYGGMGLGFEPRTYDRDRNRASTRLYPYTAGIFGASNNMAVRRDVFLALGGFDETLGPATPAFGAEDLDLFLGLVLAGHRIAYRPGATVRHAHRDEWGDLYWQVFTYSAGFTAFLTKWALSDAGVALDLARRVPALVPAALLARRRGSATDGIGDYPRALRWLERCGYLYGPVAYLRARLRRRHAQANPS